MFKTSCAICVNISKEVATTVGTSHVRHGRVPCPGDHQLRGHLLPDRHVGGGRHLLHPHVRLLALPRGHGRGHLQQHRQVRNSEQLPCIYTISNITFRAIKPEFHFRCSYDFDVPEFAAVSAEGKQFISSLLVKEPSRRLSATEVTTTSQKSLSTPQHHGIDIVFQEILLTFRHNALCAEPGPRLAGGPSARPR